MTLGRHRSQTSAAGEVSFDSAHVICRAASQIPDPGMAQVAEEQMLAFARFPQPEPERPDGGPGPGRAAPALDPGQLRHLGEELIYRADPAGAEERERRRFERRHLSFGFTLEDAGTITGACGDTLSAEIIKTAVHAFGPPLGTEDTRTAAQRRMDGLTAACQAAPRGLSPTAQAYRAPTGRPTARTRPMAQATPRPPNIRRGRAWAPGDPAGRAGSVPDDPAGRAGSVQLLTRRRGSGRCQPPGPPPARSRLTAG